MKRSDAAGRLGARITLLALVLVGSGWAPAAAGAGLEVWSAGAMEPGLYRLIDPFARETGNPVQLTVAVPASLRQRVESGRAPDVLILPAPMMEALVRAGKVKPDGQALVGRVGVGITVREGAPAPDISSVEQLKRSLLDAESIVYNRASTGIYFERLLERLGIADAVKGKATRYADGFGVLDHVVKGHGREIGIGAVTEIKEYESKGLRLVGPLPADVQNYTSYVAGVPTAAKSPDSAAAFIRFVTTPLAKTQFAATGVE
jgi:molybdate transport system substrate-binding protein